MDIPIKVKDNSVVAKALVYRGLSHNLLSTTPFFKKIGTILLDKPGVALKTQGCNNTMQPIQKYFANQI